MASNRLRQFRRHPAHPWTAGERAGAGGGLSWGVAVRAPNDVCAPTSFRATIRAVESFLDQYGYLALMLGTYPEGETAILVASSLIHRGVFSYPVTVLAAFIGAFIGDWSQQIRADHHST